MRATLLAFTLLAFTCIQVFGQQTYERTFSASAQVTDWSVCYSTLDNTLWYTTVEGTDVVLYHLNGTGVVTSTYHYGGLNPVESNVEQSVNGNIYVSGRTSGSGIQYYVLALDFSGSVLWSKTYATGGLMSYDASKIRTLNNGNVMIVESVYGHLGYIEIDGITGSVVNSVQLREDTTVENKTPGFAGDIHDDGSFVFTGKRGSDIAVVHTTAQGNVLWSTVLNSGTSYYHTKGVAALSDGTTLACGMDMYSPFIMRLDANGGVMWYNGYNGNSTFYDIEQIDANTFGVCGVSGYDFTYTRFDMSGNEIGTIRFAHPGMMFTAYELVVDATGKVAIPFAYQETSTWVQGPGLILLDANFAMECGMNAETMTPSTSSLDPSIVNVPIYSLPQSVATANVICSPMAVPTAVTTDLCIILGDEEIAGEEFSLQNTPAATGTSVTMSFGDYRGDLTYVVTDLMGREVSNAVITYGGGFEPIRKSEQLPSGVYVVTVYMDGTSHSEKFVIR